MTKPILNMSKEELINNIAATDRQGKELEQGMRELIDMRAKLLAEADKLQEDIERGMAVMEGLALANTQMRQLLKDRYGSVFVM